MEKAFEIDIYGNEKIISVDEAKKKIDTTISVKDRRFFCPQCGEYLSFVRREKYKSFFRHTKLDENAKRCELRSKGINFNYLYNNQELNLFIKKYEDTYKLAIGFRKIKSKDMLFLKNNNGFINILDNKKRQLARYKIDEYNFSDIETTYKEINWIENKYYFEYSTPIIRNIMKRYWGGELEGNISNLIFTYGDLGGRRIRKNEELIMNKNYFLVAKSLFLGKYIDNIEYEELGYLNLNERYKIYKIKVYSKSNEEFIDLKNFFRERYNVRLVKNEEKIITIWPPVIRNDNEDLYYLDTKDLFLIFESYIENSFLTSHDELEKKDSFGDKILEENYLHIFKDIDEKIAISCNGNNYLINKFYSRYENENQENTYIVEFKDTNDKVLECGEYDELPKEGIIKIKTNFRCNIILRKKENQVKIYKIENENCKIIDKIEFGDEIYIDSPMCSSYNIKFTKKEKRFKEKINEEILYNQLIKLGGPSVPTPIEIRKLLLKVPTNSKCYNLIRKYMFEKKIPSLTLKYLKKYYLN